MDNLIIYIIGTIVGVIILLNIIKIFINIFTRPKVKKEELDPLQKEIREEVNEVVKPHLTSLEGMYEKSNSDASSFASFVFSVVKDKFSKYLEKDEALVESEICKCCGDYEGAECKESFCLESSGISCSNAKEDKA